MSEEKKFKKVPISEEIFLRRESNAFESFFSNAIRGGIRNYASAIAERLTGYGGEVTFCYRDGKFTAIGHFLAPDYGRDAEQAEQAEGR